MLASALTAIRAGDLPTALCHLLDAWRASRLPVIADAIDQLTARIDRPPITARTSKAYLAAWNAIEAKRDPCDLPRLLAPWPNPPHLHIALVEALRGWPDDPRLCAPFVDKIALQPRFTWTTHRVWHPMLVRIGTTGDTRAAPLLQALLARPDQAMLHDAVNETLHALSEVTPIEADAGLLAELARMLAVDAPRKHSTEGDLLAAIRDNPDDTGALAVYADLLVERGDSLGELLVLQLQRGDGPPIDRELALLPRHSRRLAGPLADYLDPTSIEYARGVPVAGVLHQDLNYNQAYTVMKDPAWRTIRRLAGHPRRVHEGYYHERLAEWVVGSTFHRLRALHDITTTRAATLLRQLATHHDPPIDELSVSVPDDERASLTTFTEALAVDRRVRWLGVMPIHRAVQPYLSARELQRWLAEPPAALEELVVAGDAGELYSWIQALLAAPRSIAFTLISDVTLRDLRRPKGWQIQFADRVLRVAWHPAKGFTPTASVLITLLDKLAPGEVTRFELARSRALTFSPADQRAIKTRLDALGLA